MNNNKTFKQVEKDLQHFLEKHGIEKKVSLEDIKKWIWNASGPAMEATQKYQKRFFNLLPPTDNIDELNDIMQVITDTWNFFPHKALDGRSPHQMYAEAYGTNPTEQSSTSKGVKEMPKVMVGGREMEFKEFQAMIKKMEKAQKPFKKWIEKDALPKYEKYLEQMVKVKRLRDEHYEVADIFFQRVLHVGFLDLRSIRLEFIMDEFPRWWPTHVMYSHLKPAGVQKSLRMLFEFIELVYGAKE